MVPEGPEAPADGSTLGYLYPRVAPSPARLLQGPRQTYLNARQTLGSRLPLQVRKRQPGSQLPKPTCATGRLVWGRVSASSNSRGLHKETQRVREGQGVQTKVPDRSNRRPGLCPGASGGREGGLGLVGQMGVSTWLSRCSLEGLMLKLKLQ